VDRAMPTRGRPDFMPGRFTMPTTIIELTMRILSDYDLTDPVGQL
jgi:hypothetical protein